MAFNGKRINQILTDRPQEGGGGDGGFGRDIPMDDMMEKVENGKSQRKCV